MMTPPRRRSAEEGQHPELGLLLALLSPESPNITQSESVDGQLFAALAQRHGITPLITSALENTELARNLPNGILDSLRQQSRLVAQKNLLLTAELMQILPLLENEGIAAVPYKGPVLACLLYGNLGARTTGDLDLLLHPHQVTQAQHVLSARGYEATRPMGPREQEAQLQAEGALELLHPTRHVRLDLHCSLAPHHLCIDLDIDGMLKRVEMIPFAGMSVRCLRAEDLLLALSIHAAKHGWQRLIWLSDIAALLRRSQDLNWDVLLQSAQGAGVERILCVSLLLARDSLRASLPEHVLEHCRRDRRLATLEAQVRAGWTEPAGVAESSWQQRFFLLRLREGALRQLCCLWRYAGLRRARATALNPSRGPILVPPRAALSNSKQPVF